MEEIELVKRHAQQRDQRVVPASHQEQGDHVDDGEDTRPVPEGGSGLDGLVEPRNAVDAEDDVGRKVADQEQELEPRGQGAEVDGGAHLDLAVVALPEHGGVERVALDEGQAAVGDGEVPLLLVVEAHDMADLLDELVVEAPDEQGGGDGAADDHEVVHQALVLGDDGGIRGQPSSSGLKPSSLTAAGGGPGLELGGHFRRVRERFGRGGNRKERTGCSRERQGEKESTFPSRVVPRVKESGRYASRRYVIENPPIHVAFVPGKQGRSSM